MMASEVLAEELLDALRTEVGADVIYPAPRVVLFDDATRLLGRRVFVMKRLPGRPIMGGIRMVELVRSGRQVFRRLVEVTASLRRSMSASPP